MMHTPPPWHVGTDGNVYSGETGGDLIATVAHGSAYTPSLKGGNAALIVAAVNHHAALLTAARNLLHAARIDGGAPQAFAASAPGFIAHCDQIVAAWRELKAAVAEAAT